tara:strand:+ start:98 stop:856 length:759 start_codon:yes stop_codon:yes gene_type:complete
MDKKTKNFFDKISSSYSSRYSSKDKRNFFFNERLNFSLSNESLENKSILDIGAGNGMIYWKTKHQNVNYYACDISEKMMIEGGIPSQKRFQIKKDFPKEIIQKKYDFIFLLGLTAYLTKEEFDNYLKIISQCSNPGTKVIISYTLKNKFHKFCTSFLKKIYKIFVLLFKKENNLVISSNILLNRMDIKSCFKISRNLLVYDYRYHNFIPAPFDIILPNVILKIIYFISSNWIGSNRLKFISTDLIIKYRYVD